MKLDQVDRRILSQLQADGTLSQNALAGSVGASAASCWRRIKALENEGILGSTVRLVDAERIGLSVHAFCRVRLTNHLPATSRAFESFLAGRPEIIQCYAICGDWDYLMHILTKDVAAYEDFLRRHLLSHPVVAASSSEFALSQRKYTTALPV